MTFSEYAVSLHDEKKYNCCQSVFCSACERCGFNEEKAYQLGAFFNSGMRRESICGCVTGALMVLGLKYGDEQNRDCTESIQFMNAFESKFGTLECSELVKKNTKAYCPVLIAFTADYLEEKL